MAVWVTCSVFVEYHILNLPPSRFEQLCTPKTVSILLSYMHSIVRVIVPNCGMTE